MSSNISNDEFEVLLADKRYELIGKIVETSVIKGERKWSLSDMLDKVYLDKYLGIPIFLLIIWVMFQFTYVISAPFMDMTSFFFLWLGNYASLIPNEMLASFVREGLIGGLGLILIFVAPISFLFFTVAVLEDSGYMARAAFVMDRIMFRIGLTGRSFIPIILGFGCNVPAIMATRSIEGEKDRLITILINPFISCNARLPIYVLFAGTFFGNYAGLAIWSMYLLGIIVAIFSALLFRNTILRGEPAPLILELPMFRRPSLKNAIRLMWNRTSIFVQKVFTYLLIGAIALWILSNFPWGVDVEYSFAGMFGHLVEPIFKHLGFDWRGAVAFVFGFFAKEIVVETFGILYAVEGKAAIATAISGSMTALSGFAYMAFSLLYIPCLATLATIRKETGSWKWTVLAVIYGLIVAYLVTTVIVGLGRFIGFG
jgi:ferrous iron transport protein B